MMASTSALSSSRRRVTRPITRRVRIPKYTPSKTTLEKKATPMIDVSKTQLGGPTSSVTLAHFLPGRKPGTGILHHLPGEIIQKIASCLQMPELGNLRLACKDLESRSFWYFTKTYFQEAKFMPTKYALEALVAMSKSRMAQYVRTLSWGPPSNDQGPIMFLPDRPVSAGKQEKILTAMHEYSEENRTMRALGEDVVLILTALQNLRSVTEIKFLAPPTCNCAFCLANMVYGGRYLAKTVVDRAAVFLPAALDTTQTVSRLLHVTLHAAQIVGLKLERIGAHVSYFLCEDVDESTSTGFSIYPLMFPLAPPGEKPSDGAFANLTVLKLFIGNHHDVCDSDRRKRLVARVATFLARAPALRTLGLTMQEMHGAPAFLQQLFSSTQLHKIRELELGHLRLESNTLFVALVSLRRTLRALKLFNLLLSDDAYIEMLTFLRDGMEKLDEVVIEGIQGYPRDTSYKGDAMWAFYAKTIKQWTLDKAKKKSVPNDGWEDDSS